jgi:hypothetical protein
MSVTVYDPPPADLRGLGRSIALLPGVVQLAQQIADTEFVKSALRGKVPAITAAILAGDEVGFGPMQSLKYLSVIDGQPTISAEGQRALILAAGHQMWFEPREVSITKFTWYGQRREDGHIAAMTFTMDDAKRAGLANKYNWRMYPQAMLSARASAALARAIFADTIGGLSATEELEDGEPSNVPEVPPDQPPAEGDPAPASRRKRSRRGNPPVVAPTPPTAPDDAPQPPLPGEAGTEEPPRATQAQMRAIFPRMRDLGMGDRETRLAWVNAHLDREIKSSDELTAAEANSLINALDREIATAALNAEAGGEGPQPVREAGASAGERSAQPADLPPASPPLPGQGAFEDLPPDSPESPAPAAGPELVTDSGISHIEFLRNEAGVPDVWMRGQLMALGVENVPARGPIRRGTLAKLTREQANKLKQELSAEIDLNNSRD